MVAVYPCTYRELYWWKNFMEWNSGISLYLQGTLQWLWVDNTKWRYIPVPTGNSHSTGNLSSSVPVYPCTYRELADNFITIETNSGISLYLQGTLLSGIRKTCVDRYIPVPTGNSHIYFLADQIKTVYPCTYRELNPATKAGRVNAGISLYLQGTQISDSITVWQMRYIPVPTGNSFLFN